MKTYDQKNTDKKTIVSEPAVAYAASNFGTFVYFDDYSLVKKSREGLNTNLFYKFSERVGISEKRLASLLNLSSRTVSNYRDNNKSLEANYSEHLLKLIALFEAGKEYLGSYEEFKNWLTRPFWDSADVPEDFLNTAGGVDLVSDRLERMAQGYPI